MKQHGPPRIPRRAFSLGNDEGPKAEPDSAQDVQLLRRNLNAARRLTVAEQDLHLDRGFQAKLREAYLDRDAKCPRCRYHLRGVPGPRCPECGLVITEFLRVADTTGWRLQRARMRWLARRIWAMAAIVFIVTVTVVGAALWL